jgi:cytoskeletal protein CcmA (bactofilin family)
MIRTSKPRRARKQERFVSYFSASKNDIKVAPKASDKIEAARPLAKPADDVSTLGAGMLVTGNIICTGSLQVFGRVVGDIHAAHLTIRDGARVEGKVIAADAIVEGQFNGTIHGNTVKLQKSAVVEGEIFNKSLSIEQDARFEGVSRRLERAVEGPSAAQRDSDNVQPAPAATPFIVRAS